MKLRLNEYLITKKFPLIRKSTSNFSGCRWSEIFRKRTFQRYPKVKVNEQISQLLTAFTLEHDEYKNNYNSFLGFHSF